MASFPNIWTHRKVADTAAKSCEICYKPSTKFEEKQKKRKEKEKEDEKDKEKDEKEKKDGEKEKEKKTDEKLSILASNLPTRSHPQSKPETPKSPATPSTQDEEPRVFALKAAFYQQRIDKKRNAEIARRNRERLQNPNLFPQVPKGLP
ncbi:VPS4-associated 1 protein [Rutstroemia sp. NJR-2017a BBW]|nr:VPS4-associated 1 protein [Rutstroemia sp. NJR-2017a BBW]